MSLFAALMLWLETSHKNTHARVEAFLQWLKDWGANAEKGLGLWLIGLSSYPLYAYKFEPHQVPYAETLQQGGMGFALGVWLLWVNPVKRAAKRRLAVERKIGCLCQADKGGDDEVA